MFSNYLLPVVHLGNMSFYYSVVIGLILFPNSLLFIVNLHLNNQSLVFVSYPKH
ncbi:hypothetical protein EZS27_005584 [termite gut metagenome]|uniref:Uncharacterized protein n=1 Tax=termite gut metagenome TaxID=433724 RepID=A0A5J4SNU5_9ZZZZ